MAKRVFTSQGLTYTATAVTTALTSATYMAMRGGVSTQVIDVLEIMISGKATASTVAAMDLTRSSTVATTPTALAAPNSDGPMHPATNDLATTVSTFTAAATGPLASGVATNAKLNLALNLFGGIVRWNAAPTQQWTVVGATAPGGESVLWNSSTGGGSSGLADAHWIYEPF